MLVQLCLGGDTAAWQALLLRHRPLVMAVAWRSGLRGDDAEDIFQSVCLTLLERLELLRDYRSLAAWIATTTARKCWRHRGAAAMRLREATFAPDTPVLPEQEFIRAREQEAVRRALDGLSEPCRRLLRLMFVEEIPYRDLAPRVGLAVGSLGVYRRRCLARLRAELEAGGWLAGRTEGDRGE